MKRIQQKFKLRQLFFFLALIAIAILVIRNFGHLEVFWALIRSVNLLILLPIIFVRYMSYWTNARYFERYFQIFNRKIAMKKLFSAVIAMNFVNTVFPLGSISGTTFFAGQLKEDVDPKTATVGQIVYQALSMVSYLSFMVIAFLSLFFSRQITGGGYRLIILMILGIITIGVVALLIVLNRSVAEWLLLALTRPLNAVLRRVGFTALSKRNLHDFIDEFYETIGFFVKNNRSLLMPLWYAWQGVFWEVATIYVVLLAFHQFVNPGVVIAAYILALIFSTASVFTAGVGVYEATMVAVFVALGLTFTAAVSVVVVYRVIAMWLFLPFGLVSYRKALRQETDGD